MLLTPCWEISISLFDKKIIYKLFNSLLLHVSMSQQSFMAQKRSCCVSTSDRAFRERDYIRKIENLDDTSERVRRSRGEPKRIRETEKTGQKVLWTSTSFSSRNTLLTFARTCFCCETEKFTRPQQNVTHRRRANEDENILAHRQHHRQQQKGEKLSETCEHFWILNIRITLFVLCPQILLLSWEKCPNTLRRALSHAYENHRMLCAFQRGDLHVTFSWHHGKLLALPNRRELVENSHLQGLESFDWEKSKIFSHFLSLL